MVRTAGLVGYGSVRMGWDGNGLPGGWPFVSFPFWGLLYVFSGACFIIYKFKLVLDCSIPTCSWLL